MTVPLHISLNDFVGWTMKNHTAIRAKYEAHKAENPNPLPFSDFRKKLYGKPIVQD